MGLLLDDWNYPFDLGSYEPQLGCYLAPKTREWFIRGLIWCFAFNHEEAIRCFEKACQEDPDESLCKWGLAYSMGPNYNKPWMRFEEKTEFPTVRENILRLVGSPGGGVPVGDMLLAAMRHRVPPKDPKFRSRREICVAYADAMKKIYQGYPNDKDIATLYADALMNISPWNFWYRDTGEAVRVSRALEAKTVLEEAMTTADGAKHPGILHMYIHLMEGSRTPEAAYHICASLSHLSPDAGHLIHMGSHIEVLMGHYDSAIELNQRACDADDRFVKFRGNKDWYTFFRIHNFHSLIYAAMFAGQRKTCLDAALRLRKAAPEELVRYKDWENWLESFLSVWVHIWIRFGMWDRLKNIGFSQDGKLYCVSNAMTHYGKGIAFAATNEIEKATMHYQSLKDACSHIPEERTVGSFGIPVHWVMKIAVDMLAGELEYRKGNYQAAFQHLRDAIRREDNLPYSEPWAWMQPTRHAYGALLLEQGHIKEARQAYEQDLGLDKTQERRRWHPDNIWALHGLHECLLKDSNSDPDYVQEIRAKLDKARKSADVDVRASCFCKQTAQSCCSNPVPVDPNN